MRVGLALGQADEPAPLPRHPSGVASAKGRPRAFLQAIRTPTTLLLLASVVWAARFLHSGQFGLYEDDFTIVPGAIRMTASQLWIWVGSYIVALGGHGRPLSNSFFAIFAHAGWVLDGMQGMYILGYVFVTINVLLFYSVLRRLAGESFGIVGALAYALYSADTTQAYLNHSLGLQQSITFCLLGVHAYLSRWPVVFYLMALGSLLCYETVYPLAFAVPLLAESWDRSLLRRLLWNAMILALLIVGILGLRMALGEGRVEGLTWPGLLTIPLSHMIEGPLVSLGTYVYRPVQALRGSDLESLGVVLPAFAGLFWMLSQLDMRGPGLPALLSNVASPREWVSRLRRGGLSGWLNEESWRLLRLGIAGLAMLVLAYPLTFTVRAYAISGRDTRVHFAGVVGASLIIACACWAALRLGQAFGRRVLAGAGVAAWFALLLGFGLVIQMDYVNAWTYQRQFWSAVLPLIPDVQDGTAVLVDPSGLRDTRQIGANYWNMPRVLNQIFEYPSAWQSPPRLYRMTPDWRDHILGADGLVRLDGSTTVAPPSTYQTVDPGNVILITTASGRVARESGRLELPEGQIGLKQIGTPTGEAYPKGFLYDLLISSAGVGR